MPPREFNHIVTSTTVTKAKIHDPHSATQKLSYQELRAQGSLRRNGVEARGFGISNKAYLAKLSLKFCLSLAITTQIYKGSLKISHCANWIVN